MVNTANAAIVAFLNSSLRLLELRVFKDGW
jgi:hypothetical protein